MVKVVGIDPGTKLWGIVGLKDSKIIYENSFPTRRVIDKPELLIDILDSIKDIDLIVAPSGYGIPLTPIKDVTSDQLFELTLKRKKNHSQIVGLEKVIQLLIEKDYNAYFIPSVKHLPTVIRYRKINKIDMGTADKVCTAALAILDQAINLNIDYNQTNFILIEIGSGFTAILGIENGKIIDGIGGSSGGLGFISGGAIDGELAYYLGNIKKNTIYQGGVMSIIGSSQISPEEFEIMIDKDDQSKSAFLALIESISKSVAAMRISVKNPKNILLSGRLSRINKIKRSIISELSTITSVRSIKGLPESKLTKEAAQGAAIIADGLAGGKFESLIECLELKNAKGSIFDDIYYNLSD